jgi:hypothetical protein
VVKNKGGVLNLFADLGKNGIVNYEIAFPQRYIFKLDEITDLIDNLVKKGSPAIPLSFKSIKCIFLAVRPLFKMFFTKNINRGNFQQR